jgi:hypothetical protein
MAIIAGICYFLGIEDCTFELAALLFIMAQVSNINYKLKP